MTSVTLRADSLPASIGTERSSADRQQERAGLKLAAPAAILLLLLLFLPSALVLLLSFTDYEFGMGGFRFVGLANYLAMASEPQFRSSFLNTFLYVAIVAPASIVLGLILALLIEEQGYLKGLYRTVFFLPVTATLVAMATAWEVLLHPTFGLANVLLATFGLPKVRFLSDPGIALYTLAFIGIWKQVGYNILLFIAGLSTIPRDLYEAAAIDGADQGLRRFSLVTWPMLGPVTLFVVVITLIRAFSEFETIAVLTDGGPVGSTSMVLFTLYEEAFRFFRIGIAATIAVTFLAFVGVISIVKIRFADRQVHYG